jgi:hypothetical protein
MSDTSQPCWFCDNPVDEMKGYFCDEFDTTYHRDCGKDISENACPVCVGEGITPCCVDEAVAQ